MALSAEQWSKFAVLHRQWWRLHMSEKFSSGTINSKQTKKNLKSESVWTDIYNLFALESRVHDYNKCIEKSFRDLRMSFNSF